MNELSFEETSTLVESYVKSFGGRGAARALTKNSFRSPEGKEIQHGTITRILSGSETRLLAPEVKGPLPGPEQALPLGEQPPSVAPQHEEPVAMPMPIADIERENQLAETHFVNRKILRQQLEDEVAAQKLKQEGLPDEVPSTEDYGGAGHPHLQELARVHAVFSPRAPIEMEEEKSFFTIPRLKRKPIEVRTRPHEVTHFGSNVISSRGILASGKRNAPRVSRSPLKLIGRFKEK